jgi:hypothetical protein
MAFMTASVSYQKDYFMVSDDLEEAVFCKYNSIHLPEGHYDENDDLEYQDEDVVECIQNIYKEHKVSSFDIVYKYYGQLEAPGYMDQTDYCFGDSQAEVAQQLLDMYYDGEVEYMDEGEKADMAFLQSIIDEEEKREAA